MGSESTISNASSLDHEHCKHKMPLWDRLGVFVSGLCVVHCVGFPLLILTLPYIMGPKLHNHNHSFHKVIFVLIILVASVAFVRGYLHHRQLKPVLWFFSGLAFIIASFLLGGHHPGLLDVGLSVFGSALIIRAHFLNHVCRICNT